MAALESATHVRTGSGSTLKATTSRDEDGGQSSIRLHTSLNVHTDAISREHILFSDSALSTSGLQAGDLVEIKQATEATAVRDFENSSSIPTKQQREDEYLLATSKSRAKYLCTVVASTAELTSKQQHFELSMHKSVATTFGFESLVQVVVSKADLTHWTSSHVEICFRDAYLSRSDMWRFACQELLGKTVHVGQRLTFLSTLKATVKNIHLAGKRAKIAYFGHSTVPVFRSEAARYVIFVQMSQEMWDFDSEGDGEILFNRVVNGFLPELFKRWSLMEMRHLVSIVMFGRLEYRPYDVAEGLSSSFANSTSFTEHDRPIDYQDFYRVVVTDMASAQWTTILEELKKGFRVFLRDVSLFRKPESGLNVHLPEEEDQRPQRITGKLSGAMKGNILEAINLAASQFSRDYVDRDLIRTGISTVIITAGSGVFDVDRELLRLTSETLTNNGIGIDVVCLSRMPLHSVPLFRYRLKDAPGLSSNEDLQASMSHGSSLPDLGSSPAFSSPNASLNYFNRFPSAFPTRMRQIYGLGVPEWIDLSYWSSEMEYQRSRRNTTLSKKLDKMFGYSVFVPRVRMYEVQMMGLTEMGMAEISIPYLDMTEGQAHSGVGKRKTEASRSQLSRSISRSPELKRKSPAAEMWQNRVPRECNNDIQSSKHMDRYMGIYDENVFSLPNAIDVRSWNEGRANPSKHRKLDDNTSNILSTTTATNDMAHKSETDDRSDNESIVSAPSKPLRPAKAPRNFSYSVRGLIPFKASAITAGVQTDSVKAEKSGQSIDGLGAGSARPVSLLRNETTTHISQLTNALANRSEKTSRPSTANAGEEASQPIPIEANDPKEKFRIGNQRVLARETHYENASLAHSEESDLDLDGKRSDRPRPLNSLSSSVPKSNIPFVQNVNASNPLKKGKMTGQFGRWQHVYPRKAQAATVKWRSLCTPAAVPLTTSDFPSHEELESSYEALSHTIHLPESHENHPYSSLHALFLEMVSLRVAHGYQFVTGQHVSETVNAKVSDCYSIGQRNSTKASVLVVVMTMGNAVQKLAYSAEQIEVTKYVEKSSRNSDALACSINYCPYLKTILSNNYFPRQMAFRGFSEGYPWNEADRHLAGEGDVEGLEVGRLRYWRARYVLIPVEPPTATWKKQQTDESEEEIHLQGIRALTQLWQKNKYVKPQDRVSAAERASKRKDENPLAIRMETLSASMFVATELDKLTQAGHKSQLEPTQLLPETHKLDRDCTMFKLAQAMQNGNSLEIRDWKWHLRNHEKSFKGDDFTTWLKQNVKNIDTREEAVAFGNQLMKEGLFEHVRGRHDFRDGTYFYRVKAQYKLSEPEAHKSDTPKPWFFPGRSSGKSIPATPTVERPDDELSPSTTTTPRSGSNLAQRLGSPFSTSKQVGERTKNSIKLSSMIRIDVDTKRRSLHGRPEVVNVHYDRFHNPENCSHIELNWLTATCKLVDDAIVSWTNTVDRFGLKLVEVPITEAVDVPLAEPFRNPYIVKLSMQPPSTRPANISSNSGFFTNNPFAPQASAHGAYSEKHVYQKAILKRFNFVLDLEALDEFPEGVDIQYSWGQHNYKYTQFVHRSGVVLAQIVEDGNILLLANRLYNSRLVNTRETNDRMFNKSREGGPYSHRPAVPPTIGASMQASGIVGVNLASPSTIVSSPGLRPMPSLVTGPSPAFQALNHMPAGTPAGVGKAVMADSFGPKSAFAATGLWNTLITPEQIKDELERFCQDKNWLEAFYKEVASAIAPAASGVLGFGSRKTTGSSSSSLLRPMKDVPGVGASDITGIPAFELPEAVTAMRQLRRATVAYDSHQEMMDRSRVSSRHGSIGSGSNAQDKDSSSNDQSTSGQIPPSPLRNGSD